MTDDTINKTKRKLIMQSIAKHDGTKVSYTHVLILANRHQLPPEPISRLLASMGYEVEAPPSKPIPAPPPPAPSVPLNNSKVPTGPGVPMEVINMILRGGIYKKLDDDPGADPSTVFVVTTLDKFRREREAIRKLLQHVTPKGA